MVSEREDLEGAQKTKGYCPWGEDKVLVLRSNDREISSGQVGPNLSLFRHISRGTSTMDERYEGNPVEFANLDFIRASDTIFKRTA